MITAEYNKEEGKIILRSDDVSTKALLEYRRKETVWSPWVKSWRTEEKIDKLYDNIRTIGPKNGIWTFKLGLGWASFCAGLFKKDMHVDSYNNLLRAILSDIYRTLPFPNLRDYQNDDVLHLLKYKIGLASLNTGYGKITFK